MRQKHVLGRRRYEDEVSSGLWPRVKARLRPLRPWEQPADLETADDRMIEFDTAEGDMRVYDDIGLCRPLHEPDLLPDFLRVFGEEGPAEEKAVVEFYARYGPLRERMVVEGETLPVWAERLEPADRGRLSREARLLLCEPVWWLQMRAREVQLTYDLYLALKERKLPALRSMLGGVPPGKRILGIGIVAGQVVRQITDERKPVEPRAGSFAVEPDAAGVITGEGLRLLAEEECRGLGSALLAAQLNIGEARSIRRWEHYVETEVALTPKKLEPLGTREARSVDLVRARGCNDLIGALYLQLGELVEQEAALRECPGCRRLFYRHHGRQDYCSPHCGDAARQRTYYRGDEQAKARERARAARAKKKRRT